MITITYNEASTTLRGYIDGISTKNYTTNINIADSSSYIKTVGSDFSGSLIVQGQLDEFSKWNRTLSDDEVSTLYNSGLGITWNPSPSPPIPLSPSVNSNQKLVDDIIGLAPLAILLIAVSMMFLFWNNPKSSMNEIATSAKIAFIVLAVLAIGAIILFKLGGAS